MISWGDIIILLTVVIGLLYLYCKNSFNYWKSRGVPHRKPTFLLGNLLDIIVGKDFVGRYITKLYDEFDSPYIGFYALTKPFLLLKDPDIIKRVLIKDFQIFSNRYIVNDETIDPIASNALFGIKTPQWKTLRSKLSPVFSSGKMKMMLQLMEDCGNNLEQYINSVLNEEIEMKEVASKYSTNVISSCVFGITTNSFVNENCEFRHHASLIFPTNLLSSLRSMTYFLAPALVKTFRYKFINSTATNFFRKVFTETMNQREQTKIKRNDLIDLLIELKNEDTGDDKYKFYGDRLVAQAMIFFNAGQETTSSAIAFTMHELCINADIQDKLRKEINEVIEKYGKLTYEALQDMKYLHMIVSETLRKYPLTPFLHRECAEDYKIPETGLVIERGTPVIIPQPGLHWDQKYFPEPEKYDPERFNEENKHRIPSCVYLPFGDGPRNCIGERFALMSTKLGVVHLIKNFRAVKNAKTEDQLLFGPSPLLRAKNGVQLTLKRL